MITFVRLLDKQKQKVNFSDLTARELNQLYILDDYPSEHYHFEVLGYDISVKDDRVSLALLSLPIDNRNLILLAYFLNMTDREIGEKINLALYSVQRRRTKSLMKKLMEDKDSEKATQKR